MEVFHDSSWWRKNQQNSLSFQPFDGDQFSRCKNLLRHRHLVNGGNWLGGGEKCIWQALTRRLGRLTPFRRTRVIFWMMDSATSPFGSAQNDRVGGTLRRVKFFGLNKPTKRKSSAICMSWSLMQCVMTYYWTESIGFWLKHVFSIEEKVLIVSFVAAYIKELVSSSSFLTNPQL